MADCKDHIKCVETSLKQADLICLDNKLRFTELRKKVFSIISKSHEPAKAYDILSELQKEDSTAKPSTVYRTLDFLLENGLIHKLHSSNSYALCGHPAKKHGQCYFLICEKCNVTKECCSKSLTSKIEDIAKDNNFITKNITIEIRGLCSNCSVN